MKQVVIIGGGTGTYVVARGLKQFKNLQLTKIVTAFDSGGSTGRLRDEFGFLPVGDLRQSLSALAAESSNHWLRQLLLYRFPKGRGLKGHNLGNLILTALQDISGSTPKALHIASQILRLQGQVYPITTTTVDLKITYQSGKIKIGEHHLDDPKFGGHRIKALALTQPAYIYPPAKQALLSAQFIIIGPGDIFGSLVPNFIVRGAKPTLSRTKAKIIYISNLMTRFSQTHQFTAQDHVHTIERYLHRPLDYVIVNQGSVPSTIATHYRNHKEYPVIDDLLPSPLQIIRDNFVSTTSATIDPTNPLPRTLLRHHQARLIKALKKIIKP